MPCSLSSHEISLSLLSGMTKAENGRYGCIRKYMQALDSLPISLYNEHSLMQYSQKCFAEFVHKF